MLRAVAYDKAFQGDVHVYARTPGSDSPPLPSFSRPQVALSIRYGHVLLYDDTAVKNKYTLPVGIGAVIDGEYFTRVAFQMISSDTQAETFEWMMEGWMEARGGEGPDVFIQDANGACT